MIKNVEVATLLMSALESSNVSVTITNSFEEGCKLIYANYAFEVTTQYSCDESVGKNLKFLQGKNTDPKSVARIRSLLEENLPVSVDIINYRKDGSEFLNGLELTPIRNHDRQVIGFCGFQTDVSLRNEGIEEEMQKIKARIVEHVLSKPL